MCAFSRKQQIIPIICKGQHSRTEKKQYTKTKYCTIRSKTAWMNAVCGHIFFIFVDIACEHWNSVTKMSTQYVQRECLWSFIVHSFASSFSALNLLPYMLGCYVCVSLIMQYAIIIYLRVINASEVNTNWPTAVDYSSA